MEPDDACSGEAGARPRTGVGWPQPAAATRTAPTLLARREDKEAGSQPPAAGRHGLPRTAPPPASCGTGVPGAGFPALPLNIGLLCSKTFDDEQFPSSLPGTVRLEEGRHGQNEHQGRVPDLDEGRLVYGSISRNATLGPGRVQELPRFRGRTSDIVHRRDGRGQRLDAHHRPHRARRGGDQADDRRRLVSPRPPKRTRGHEPLRLLSIVSRRRWPEFADDAPSIGVPPPKKKAPAPNRPMPFTGTDARRLSSATSRTSIAAHTTRHRFCVSVDVDFGIGSHKSPTAVGKPRESPRLPVSAVGEVGFELHEFGVGGLGLLRMSPTESSPS